MLLLDKPQCIVANFNVSFCLLFSFSEMVGIVANNGEMTVQACDKSTHFIQLCGQRKTPIIFLQNTTPVKPKEGVTKEDLCK